MLLREERQILGARSSRTARGNTSILWAKCRFSVRIRRAVQAGHRKSAAFHCTRTRAATDEASSRGVLRPHGSERIVLLSKPDTIREASSNAQHRTRLSPVSITGCSRLSSSGSVTASWPRISCTTCSSRLWAAKKVRASLPS